MKKVPLWIKSNDDLKVVLDEVIADLIEIKANSDSYTLSENWELIRIALVSFSRLGDPATLLEQLHNVLCLAYQLRKQDIGINIRLHGSPDRTESQAEKMVRDLLDNAEVQSHDSGRTRWIDARETGNGKDIQVSAFFDKKDFELPKAVSH
ncbi:hypothetical protein [Brevibacillus migulae]|uniref:hypothetical protein n=1 Tax=Brevibacillus migulae TaxID=1644114 RepID=UPI00106DF33A|nr:hypothetical protein [Brevibacillus migulae]